MWFLYNVLLFIYAVFALPVFWAKGKFGAGFGERLGNLSHQKKQKLSGRIVWWLHAVSVGEVALAVRFADRLRNRIAGIQILISTTTQAGYEVGQKIKSDDDVLIYAPLDFSFAVNRCIRDVSPAALVLFETELWPNLIRKLFKKFIPVFLVNGRISDHALPKYKKIHFFIRKVLGMISLIIAQDQMMKARFGQIGADTRKVLVGGNMKYDWEFSGLQEEMALPYKRSLRSLKGVVFMAGSTHEGEEEILMKVYVSMRKSFQDLVLVIAPRHTVRIPAIQKTAQTFDLRTTLISQLIEKSHLSQPSGAVILVDQVGILAALYEAADLVFVGGSLVPVGGHNLVEPAISSKPILFGRYMHNFLQMSQEFKLCQAALQIDDAQSLEKCLQELILSPEKMKAMGEKARALSIRHQGASERSLNYVLSYLDSNERSFVRV